MDAVSQDFFCFATFVSFGFMPYDFRAQVKEDNDCEKNVFAFSRAYLNCIAFLSVETRNTRDGIYNFDRFSKAFVCKELWDEDATVDNVIGFHDKIGTDCVSNSFASGNISNVGTFRVKCAMVSARSVRAFGLVERALFRNVPIFLLQFTPAWFNGDRRA